MRLLAHDLAMGTKGLIDWDCDRKVARPLVLVVTAVVLNYVISVNPIYH